MHAVGVPRAAESCLTRGAVPIFVSRGAAPSPLGPSSFMRMTVGSRAMFVSELAMFESRGCVFLRLFVLAKIVVMGRLMMMVYGGVMVSGRLVMMLTRRMLR
jgi:hypothetical protein